MGLTKSVPGLRPGRTERNLGIGVLYLTLLPLLLSLLVAAIPFAAARTVGRNRTGVAERLGALPGIDAASRTTAGAVAFVFVLAGMALIGATLPGDVSNGGGGANATAVSDCTSITESGRYVIPEDETYTGTVGSTPCITITADDVVLDGSGTTFDGRGISNTTAIRVVGAKNVTIRNLTVTDWHYGVHFVGASDGRLHGVEMKSNVYGAGIEKSSGVTVTNNHFERNIVGLRVDSPGEHTFRLRKNTFRDNHGRHVYYPSEE